MPLFRYGYFHLCYVALALLLVSSGMFTVHAAVNEFGGLIVDPIDWSSLKPVKTGDLKGELKHPTTKELIARYRLFVPEQLPKMNHLSLLICFHGKGGSENSPADFMFKNITALGLDKQYLVLGLKSRREGWEDVDEVDVAKAYQWVTSLYPIDKRRVYLIGHSSGAHWDTKYGLKHMDTIAGVMRWAGGSVRPPTGKDGALLTEWYLVHGTKDDQNSILSSREGRDNVKKENYRYLLREITEGDHGNILRMMAVTNDLVWWMNSLRHKTMALAPEDEQFLQPFSDPKAAAKLFSIPATWNELIRIGGPQAGAIIALAMQSDKPKVREFAAIACSKSRFAGDSTVLELAKLLTDKSANVRTAALVALGYAANWRCEVAQQALLSVASSTEKTIALKDRGEATVFLAKAAALPLLGNYDDDLPLWKALLLLMNDSRREIREAACAPLMTAVPDGLGYNPNLSEKERADSIAKWEAWFTSHQVNAANKQAKP